MAMAMVIIPAVTTVMETVTLCPMLIHTKVQAIILLLKSNRRQAATTKRITALAATAAKVPSFFLLLSLLQFRFESLFSAFGHEEGQLID
jgi:hypothetical protein